MKCELIKNKSWKNNSSKYEEIKFGLPLPRILSFSIRILKPKAKNFESEIFIFEKMNGDGDNAAQRRITNRRIFDHLRNAGKSPAERSYVSDIRATVLDLLNIPEDTLSDEASGQLTAKAVYLAKYIRKKWSGSQRILGVFYRLAGDYLDKDFQFPAEQPQNEVPQVAQVPHM